MAWPRWGLQSIISRAAFRPRTRNPSNPYALNQLQVAGRGTSRSGCRPRLGCRPRKQNTLNDSLPPSQLHRPKKPPGWSRSSERPRDSSVQAAVEAQMLAHLLYASMRWRLNSNRRFEAPAWTFATGLCPPAAARDVALHTQNRSTFSEIRVVEPTFIDY